MEPLLLDELDSAHSFAKELKTQLEKYFVFLLDAKHKEFLPVYWTASFLCPVYRFVISSDELPVVRSYLQSKLYLQVTYIYY